MSYRSGTSLQDEINTLKEEIEFLQEQVPEDEDMPDEIAADIEHYHDEIDELREEQHRQERRARNREFRNMVL